jgi:hypothetical protein
MTARSFIFLPSSFILSIVQILFTACRQTVGRRALTNTRATRANSNLTYQRAIDASPTRNQRLTHTAPHSLTASPEPPYAPSSPTNQQFPSPYYYCYCIEDN